ncbi:MAG: hypothetical protein NT062_30975 [Proteobacteria bacterium]|nr:hypothetical protein [Pseudomonadota bacterium]
MKKTNKANQLRLVRQVVRELSTSELAAAQGGVMNDGPGRCPTSANDCRTASGAVTTTTPTITTNP